MALLTPENRKKEQEFIIYPCSDAELERRWGIAAKAMEEHDIDYIVAAQRTDYNGQYVKWFTDAATRTENPAIVIFSRDKELVTIFQGGGYDVANPKPANVSPPDWCCRGIARRWSRGFFPALDYTAAYDGELVVRELKNKGKIRVGLVGLAFMTVQSYNYIKDNLTNAELVDFTNTIDELTVIKSPEELEMIRHVCKIQDDILFGLKNFLKPGISEQDIFSEMRYRSLLKGAENGVFLVGSSGKGEMCPIFVEHFHSKRVLQPGDTVVVLVENNGPHGMYGHITGMFSLGEPAKGLVEAMKVAEEASMFIRERLVPGGDCNQIFDEYNAWLAAQGLPPETRLLGHGQGYSLVEKPAMLPGGGERIKLAANMNFSHHPSIRQKNSFATNCANFFIKESGLAELVNTFPTYEIQVVG